MVQQTGELCSRLSGEIQRVLRYIRNKGQARQATKKRMDNAAQEMRRTIREAKRARDQAQYQLDKATKLRDSTADNPAYSGLASRIESAYDDARHTYETAQQRYRDLPRPTRGLGRATKQAIMEHSDRIRRSGRTKDPSARPSREVTLRVRKKNTGTAATEGTTSTDADDDDGSHQPSDMELNEGSDGAQPKGKGKGQDEHWDGAAVPKSIVVSMYHSTRYKLRKTRFRCDYSHSAPEKLDGVNSTTLVIIWRKDLKEMSKGSF